MSTIETKPGVDPAILADLEEVCRQAAHGVVRDPELVRRVSERAAQARQELFARFGVQDLGVPILRDMRESR